MQLYLNSEVKFNFLGSQVLHYHIYLHIKNETLKSIEHVPNTKEIWTNEAKTG